MTQTLDVDFRASQPGSSRATGAPTSTARAETSKFGTFAITFGIAFVILYTLFERQNWPLFTYHPAINRLDFWRYPGAPEDGPPMFCTAGSCSPPPPPSWWAGSPMFPARLLQRATLLLRPPAPGLRAPRGRHRRAGELQRRIPAVGLFSNSAVGGSGLSDLRPMGATGVDQLVVAHARSAASSSATRSIRIFCGSGTACAPDPRARSARASAVGRARQPRDLD